MSFSFLVNRLLLLVATLFGMLLAVFLMIHLAPGDPVQVLLGADQEYITPEQHQAIREHFGLDRPLHHQFLLYAGRVLQGDLGTSYRVRQPVMTYVRPHLLPTIYLSLAGILVAVAIGLPAGIISALYRNTPADFAALTLSIIGLSAPSFWLGLLLLYVFSFELRLFPIMGDGTGDGLLSVLAHLTLPAIVVGTSGAALIARLTRSAMLETLTLDFIRTAQAKGLPSRVVVLKHALKNAAIPVVASASTLFAYLITGSVVVEVVFSRRGLGALMIAGINGRDFPVVQGLIIIFGAFIVLVNMVTDLLMGYLDPRVSYS